MFAIGANYHLTRMVDEAGISAGPAAYRGFLFSDLRGFTAFAEKHGNKAAADKVGRFLEITRRAIARHEGAEIKTEGDAIHAVFPSASSAVLCGLDIADSATELNADEPQRPLGMGVGVHAGEAVETAEGYIGRAVNIAARLCAVAKPGEVLVSSTVKGITQSSIPVGFIARGTRRLKGISDPILVYAVTRDVNAKSPRVVPRPLLLGAAGITVVAALAIVALAASQLLAKPSTTSPPIATAAAQRVVIGPLPIGKYRSVLFEPSVTFDIADPGWSANSDTAQMLGLIRVVAPRGNLQFVHVDEVIENPCVAGGESASAAPGAADLLTTLRGLRHLDVSDSQTVRVGGYTGLQVDITVSEAALIACGGPVGGGAAIFRYGEEVWSAVPGERFTLIALTVGTRAVTILVSMDWTQTPSVQELQSLQVSSGQILRSAAFQEP